MRKGERLWLPVLLFLLTLLTTSAVGVQFDSNFRYNRAALLEDDLISVFLAIPSYLMDPVRLLPGLPFAFTLLLILFAHEMGHYLACRYYRIDASPPYFLPAPTLIGTFGAFIRIRSAIPLRTQLFDVAIAGPLAGFAFVIPAAGIGLALSKVIPGVAERGDVLFGTPLFLRVLELAVFPGVAAADITLHPIARAAWVGMLATALNLLPIGQLDGGHILYSFVGDVHKMLSRIFVAGLIPLGIFYSRSWLIWAALLFFFGMRHPKIYDSNALGPGRSRLGLLALIIFALCFTVSPIELR
jgi:membrane-associated protease RseP (regulator of RpoE activity)